MKNLKNIKNKSVPFSPNITFEISRDGTASAGLNCYAFLGANMIIAMPVNATKDPTISQTVGLIPSTDQSHRIATKTYTPP
jgi:hypothetical protein